MKKSLLGTCVVSFVALSGCMQEGQNSDSANIIADTIMNPGTEPKYDDPARMLSRAQILADYSNVSCESMRNLVDYLDQVGNTDYFRGLTGEIYYQDRSCRKRQGVWNYLDKYYKGDAVKLDAKLYLSKLDVPTRIFTLGFPKLDGTMIKNAEGDNLVEYFSIDFRTEFKLGPDDEEGEYEFAVLSDDGVDMRVGDDLILRSPNDQSTKMVCATQYVTLSRGESIPARIRYYQGPRDHIALMLLWRKAGSSKDPLCGHMGTSAFFDYTKVPSEPKPNFNKLLSRGWSVVPDHVFRIPRDEYMNPCESEHIRDIIEDENCTATTCGDIGL